MPGPRSWPRAEQNASSWRLHGVTIRREPGHFVTVPVVVDFSFELALRSRAKGIFRDAGIGQIGVGRMDPRGQFR